MLTCYGHDVRLPQNHLVYVAFRLALQDTLADIELQRDLEEEPDSPVGYLSEVPFLEQVPLPVQVDLLANTWAQHNKPDLIEASLLDAAIVYAACETASRIINDRLEHPGQRFWVVGGVEERSQPLCGFPLHLSPELPQFFNKNVELFPCGGHWTTVEGQSNNAVDIQKHDRFSPEALPVFLVGHALHRRSVNRGMFIFAGHWLISFRW